MVRVIFRASLTQGLLFVIMLSCFPAASATSSSVSRFLEKSQNTFHLRMNREIDLPHKFQHHSKLFLNKDLRGGAGFRGKVPSSRNELVLNGLHKFEKNTVSIGASITIVSAMVVLSYLNWEWLKTFLSTFFDREKLRKNIIQQLNEVAEQGHRGLVAYIVGFSFWEVCGLPTSVVETAAGMAFGFRQGLLGSFIGKTWGSIMAFLFGRTLLSRVVQIQMEKNETLQLIDKSVARHPFKSALIVRYSVFPQLFKNFGLSMTRPVSLPIFIAAIVIHGFPFSVLWAALGNDSSIKLRASELGEPIASNVVLNGFLVCVTIFGFVVSPAVTGWWLADLRKGS
mmetsp:Transcript_9918/g.19273  ORF Transcript_9918/g.19273 Transcript_9918/m.19273 type:complete len:340 (-) Transcript_9918:27-1046(-)